VASGSGLDRRAGPGELWQRGTPAEAAGTLVNPFSIIIEKLNQILAKLSTSAGGNHTLRWGTNNPSNTRCTTAFTGAVLDNNTGLVWEQAPDITGGANSDGKRVWVEARIYCINKTVGGTVGWRLPSVVELKSVQDPSLPPPFVPGTAFTNVQSVYWSASALAGDPSGAWVVLFNTGLVDGFGNANDFHAWCVRGGMNADAY